MARMLDEMTMADFAGLDLARTVLLVPVGIVEEHGPHLPLQTDGIQAAWVCAQVANRVPEAIVAPLVAHGNCSSTRNFPGSLSLSFETVRALFRDLFEEAYRNGLRKVVVVSGHAGGGHLRAIRMAGEDVVQTRRDLTLLVLSDYELIWNASGTTVAGVEIPDWDGHAGTMETARMLAIAPHLVRGRAPAHQVRFPRFEIEVDAEKHFPGGVMGDPGRATAELGHALNKLIVDDLSERVRELAKR